MNRCLYTVSVGLYLLYWFSVCQIECRRTENVFPNSTFLILCKNLIWDNFAQDICCILDISWAGKNEFSVNHWSKWKPRAVSIFLPSLDGHWNLKPWVKFEFDGSLIMLMSILNKNRFNIRKTQYHITDSKKIWPESKFEKGQSRTQLQGGGIPWLQSYRGVWKDTLF